MVCHRCGVGVRPSQRYCDQCGASLQGVTDATEELPRPPLYDFAADPDDLTSEPTAAVAAATAVSTVAPAATSDVLTATPAVRGGAGSLATTRVDSPTPIAEPAVAPPTFAPPDPGRTPVEPIVAVAPDTAEHAAGSTKDRRKDRTVELPLVVLDVDEHGRIRRRFRVGPLLVLALLAAVGAAVAAVATIVSIDTDAVAPTFATGDWTLADLGSNLSAALLVAAAGLTVGAIAHALNQRWGAGLAGGAGLALAGMAGLIVGLAEQPIQIAQGATNPAGAPPFTVEVTRDIGYVVLLVAAALGVVVFIVSLARAGRDPNGGLNPWIAALGAIAAIVAAAGPLVPEGAATMSSNWTSGEWYFGDELIDQPTAFFAGRLLQLALLAASGVLGFLLVRRYGIGLVVGAVSAVTWLSVTTLLEVGDAPVGPAYANPGSTDVDLHSVTIVGMVALVGLTVVALIAAIDQSLRDR
jgi:hypothetical protein